MLTDQVTSAGAIPALEMMVRFAGERQRILAHNMANVDTPNFRTKDVSTGGFQRMLGKAVSERRGRTGGEHGGLAWKPTAEVKEGAAGGMRLEPRTTSGNILFHDRNNRDLERSMQDLVENVGVFRVATDMLRGRYEIMRQAIAERV